MVSTIYTIIIIIGITSRLYLKYSPMKSFVTLMTAIIGSIVSLSFYELLASFLISSGFLVQWAQTACFIFIFAVIWAISETLVGFVVGANIDFGKPAKIASAIVCGVLSGFIISGNLSIALGLAPLRSSIPYARINETTRLQNYQSVKRYENAASKSNSSSPLIPADGFVVGFYNIIAKGALASGNRFDVVHADFLDQIHLNRYAAKDGVITVAAKDAVSVNKLGVRKRELPGGDIRTVIELTISNKKVKEGGAKNKDNRLSFTLAQVRLLCGPKDQAELTGDNIRVLYPETYLIKGQPVKKDVPLTEVIEFDRKVIKDQIAKIDLAFNVPENLTPRLLQFKSNNCIKLPKLATEEDIEKAALEEANKPAPQDTPEN
ncbi:MAG: rhomboid family intramembrane serine protease [Planctomycetes bacterium]|nr:rhomboid family intramembrane serine protease [Planctomycetota bacterium]